MQPATSLSTASANALRIRYIAGTTSGTERTVMQTTRVKLASGDKVEVRIKTASGERIITCPGEGSVVIIVNRSGK